MYITPYQRIVNLMTAPVQPRYFLGSILGAVAGPVIGGLFGGKGAKKASKQSAKGEREAARLTKEQYEKAEKLYDPYIKAGGRGLAGYEERLGSQEDYEGLVESDVRDPFKFGAEEFEQYKDPGYDFRFSEGERAVNRGFAGLGKRLSGERFAGLQDYGQRMGSQEFGAARGRAMQDYGSEVSREQQTYDRSLGQYGRQYTDQIRGYGSLADKGISAVGGLTKLGANAAESQGGSARGEGDAKASGTLGEYGAYSKAVGDIGNAFNGGYGGNTYGGGSATRSGAAGLEDIRRY